MTDGAEDRPGGGPLTDAELAAWSAAHRGSIKAPPELWPLVAATTIHRRAVRRQVLRSMRGPLLVGALVLVAATALVTWRVAHASWLGDDERPPAATAPARQGPLGPGQHAGHPTTMRSSRRGPPAPAAPAAPIPPEPGPRAKQ
jgi:hypothetical protein